MKRKCDRGFDLCEHIGKSTKIKTEAENIGGIFDGYH